MVFFFKSIKEMNRGRSIRGEGKREVSCNASADGEVGDGGEVAGDEGIHSRGI